MSKPKKNISGLSILEALVSTVIVGIGFVAILQMTNFSVQSIDRSGDRTKANFLTEMIAEDIIGSKKSFFGASNDDSDIVFDSAGVASLNGQTLSTFTEHLSDNGWNANLACGANNATGGTADQKKENIYEEQKIDAPRNKEAKWDAIFGENRFLKCTNTTEEKKIQVFKVCRWDECDYKLDAITDDPMYIGRVEMKLNDGKKRKFLYFQTDYKLRR